MERIKLEKGMREVQRTEGTFASPVVPPRALF